MTLSEVLLDAAALKHNFEVLRRWYGDRALFPVVKANAYGHGAELICAKLEASFDEKILPYFCVARYSEAAKIRAAGVKRRILVLSHFTATEMKELPLENIDVVVAEPKIDLAELMKLPPESRAKIGVHLKFDTGMNRLGFPLRGDDQEAKTVVDFLVQLKASGLPVKGFMSHFARSESLPSILSHKQAALFERLVRKLRGSWSSDLYGEFPEWIHMANSSGIERGLAMQFCTAARPGLHLWGVTADPAERARLQTEGKLQELRPVLSVVGPIRQFKILREGDGAGYGHRYTTKSEKLVGIVSLGYADGVFRQLSRGGTESWKLGFVVNGTRVPVAGTVSMDMTAVDLTEHPRAAEWKALAKSGQVPEGLRAEWVGPTQPIEEHAEVFQTISYEVLCALTSRLPRRWRA